MASTIAELDLPAELERLRTAPASSGLGDVRTTKDAVGQMMLRAVRLLRALPVTDLDAGHPAVGALSTLLHHPEATRDAFTLLPTEHRHRLEQVLPHRELPWSVAQLEWQWVQYVTMAGENAPLHPRLSLPEQQFASKSLQEAWNALMDLNALRMRGLVT